MTKEIEQIKANIVKIEKEWKEDIKKEHGGGLDSGINATLIKLKIALSKLENADKSSSNIKTNQ